MSDRLKVLFEHKEFDENAMEGIWVKPVGKYFEIDNIPFYVKSFALGDIISVVEREGELFAQDLIQESGHSVVRILLPSGKEVSAVRHALSEKGCASELSNVPNLISVDIPKEIEFTKIIDFLQKGEDKGDWEYQEACISDFHKQQPTS